MGKIIIGDAIETLRTLPEKSVHMCVTSPPYYGLRDYGHAGQIGLEETPDEYVSKLVEVFSDVRRVLRDDGTVWLNLGDSYTGSANAGGETTRTCHGAPNAKDRNLPTKRGDGLKPKDLIGIPWRVAFALQADGWYLRQDIIWHKPSPMPESVTDRCTKAHEYIFLLSKQARYYYDAEAVKENGALGPHVRDRASNFKKQGEVGNHYQGAATIQLDGTRNKRSVWTVTTQPYKGAHFATFPPALIAPCIKAGCPETACKACGAPWERVVEKTVSEAIKNAGYTAKCTKRKDYDRPGNYVKHSSNTIGYRPTCSCNVDTEPGTVLDPFGGSGTTGEVCTRLGRGFILIDINPKNRQLMEDRISSVGTLFGGKTE